MPVKSKAEFRFFQRNRKKLEKKGVNVNEFVRGVDYKSLPERVKPKRRR